MNIDGEENYCVGPNHFILLILYRIYDAIGVFEYQPELKEYMLAACKLIESYRKQRTQRTAPSTLDTGVQEAVEDDSDEFEVIEASEALEEAEEEPSATTGEYILADGRRITVLENPDYNMVV